MGDKPRQKKNILGGPGRSNYQIWVIAILVASVIGFTYFGKSSSAIKISDRRFEQMVLSNDVSKVVLIKNKDLVEVTLKEEALQNTNVDERLHRDECVRLDVEPRGLEVAQVDTAAVLKAFLRREGIRDVALPGTDRDAMEPATREHLGQAKQRAADAASHVQDREFGV